VLALLALGGALGISSATFGVGFGTGLFTFSSIIPLLGPLCLIVGVLVPILSVLIAMGVAMTLSYDVPPKDNRLPFVAGAVLIGCLLIALGTGRELPLPSWVAGSLR
jgi:hypothetical protein